MIGSKVASSRVSVVGRAPVDLKVTVDEALGERDRVLLDHGGRRVHGQPRHRDRLRGNRGDGGRGLGRLTDPRWRGDIGNRRRGDGRRLKLTPFAGSTWPRRTSSLREEVDWLIFVCLGVSS